MTLTTLSRMVSLALRNLTRNRRRTLVTVLLIVVGVMAMGISRGYYVQTLDGLQQITIRAGFAGSLGSGHVIVKDARYATDDERYTLEFGIENPDALIDRISTLPNFSYALPRTQLNGLASNGDKSVAFRGYSVRPPSEAELRGGLTDMAERAEDFSLGEEILKLDEAPFSALIGRGLARSLHVKKGDTILLLSTTVDGAVNAIDVTITDLLSTGSDEVDRFFLLVTHDTAVKLINSEKVGEISVMLDDRAGLPGFLPQITDELATAVPDQELQVVGWEESGLYYPAVRDLFTFMFGFLEIIIIAIVLISSWNVINMTVMERVREIGTLRSLGINQRSIFAIFVLEAFIVATIAVVIGIIVQLLIVLAINNAGIVMPPAPGGNQSFILKVRYLTWHHPVIVISILGASLAAATFVLLSIRRMSITQSLEHT